MVLRDLHEIMLGSQLIEIYISNRYEPVFIGFNSSIDDAILDKQVDFIMALREEKKIVF